MPLVCFLLLIITLFLCINVSYSYLKSPSQLLDLVLMYNASIPALELNSTTTWGHLISIIKIQLRNMCEKSDFICRYIDTVKDCNREVMFLIERCVWKVKSLPLTFINSWRLHCLHHMRAKCSTISRSKSCYDIDRIIRNSCPCLKTCSGTRISRGMGATSGSRRRGSGSLFPDLILKECGSTLALDLTQGKLGIFLTNSHFSAPHNWKNSHCPEIEWNFRTMIIFQRQG